VERSGSRLPLLLSAIAIALFVSAWAAVSPATAPAGICTKNCPEDEGGGGGGGGAPPEKPTKGPKMLVVNVGWDTGDPATSAPLQNSTIEENVLNFRGPVNKWFREAAPNIWRDWTVVPGGNYVISPPKVLLQNGCSILAVGANTFFDDLVASGDAAASAAGFSLDSYNLVVYVLSRQVCFPLGQTDAKKRRMVLPVAAVAQHEMGHILGLDDADALACTDGNGNPVTLSSTNCHAVEHGDAYDTMGSTAKGLYNAILMNALGWMGGQVVNLTAGDFSQSVTLKPLSEVGKAPRAVRLVDGQTTLWLEYRQPTGLDTPSGAAQEKLVHGLLIHREVSGGSGHLPGSQLLDVTPSLAIDPSYHDAGLRVGQTWGNPLGEMQITLNSADPTGATVTVSSRRRTVPNLLGLTAAQAEARLAGAGLKSTGWGGVLDPTCALIGLVAAQSPSAGTRVLPGNPVTVAIGERDPFNQCQ
jgi:hypothetical protein